MSAENGSGPAAERRLRVVTYNVHACIGSDGRFMPQRICEILDGLQADFIGIQELEDRVIDGEAVSAYLARTLGMHAYRGATLKRADAHYGNLLLSRQAAESTRMHDISVPGTEPRGIIEAGFTFGGHRIRLLVTHFGLRARERRRQADDLLTIARTTACDVDVLLGDFNEWRPLSYTVGALKRRFGAVPRRRTWPASRPVLALDTICVAPAAVRRSVRVADSPEARRASDHLPLVCDLELPA